MGYAKSLIELEVLANIFNSKETEHERFVNFEPQTMINAVNVYRQKLNNTFNSFVDFAKQKYQICLKLHQSR